MILADGSMIAKAWLALKKVIDWKYVKKVEHVTKIVPDNISININNGSTIRLNPNDTLKVSYNNLRTVYSLHPIKVYDDTLHLDIDLVRVDGGGLVWETAHIEQLGLAEHIMGDIEEMKKLREMRDEQA